MTVVTAVVAKFTLAGIHAWPAAPSHRSYLRQPHRHLFWFDVRVPVSHGDRAIEVHDLADRARAFILDWRRASPPTPVDFGTLSCEQIATALAEHLLGHYTDAGFVAVAVLEDGEAGASVVRHVA